MRGADVVNVTMAAPSIDEVLRKIYSGGV
jgi:hypothetical protein